MLQFNSVCIFTGFALRKSKNSGNSYNLVSFLGSEGQTFSCIMDCSKPNLEQLDKVNVTFKVVPGRYTQLRVLDLKKVS